MPATRRPAPGPASGPAPGPAALAPDVLAGSRRAIARALTAVENEGAAALVDALYPHTGRAWRVGVTGPPGAGKSTLTDRLVSALRARGQTVAVVAVDPSSPFTGGALLGDRVRLADRLGPDGAGDDGVFVRSLAARGALGGLAEAAEAACDVFDAAGFDVVVLETVGVGQGEIDVAEAADTALVVLVPESGDAVQAMKAGLMEVADVFAVNKADKPEAGRLVRALRQMLHLRPADGPDAWAPPVAKLSALSGDGVAALVGALDAHRAHLAAGWGASREARLRRRVRRLAELRLRRGFWTPARRAALDAAVGALDPAARAPHALAAAIAEGG